MLINETLKELPNKNIKPTKQHMDSGAYATEWWTKE